MASKMPRARIVLDALAKLGGSARANDVWAAVDAQGAIPSRGEFLVTVEWLEHMGYVERSNGEPEPEHGGRVSILIRITEAGTDARLPHELRLKSKPSK
jgi:hypothetical protein